MAFRAFAAFLLPARLVAVRINVEFNLSADLETAANDVRDKVSQTIRLLPQDMTASHCDKVGRKF